MKDIDIFSTRKRALLCGGAAIVILATVTPSWAQQYAAANGVSRNDLITDEVTVIGNRSSVESALEEQQKSVGVTNILSSEQIEQAPLGSVADLATLLPGLSTISSAQGGAVTGEAEYVTIRGFSSAYNAYSVNGMRLAQTDPGSRAVSLNMFSPFGFSSIKVNKTPAADQDGDAIAGVLDLRTPSGFDHADRFLRLRTQGQLSQQAAETGQKDLGGALDVEYGDQFGHGRFGVYATAYYQNKDNTAEQTAAQNPPVLANEYLSGSARQNPNSLAMNGVQWNFWRNNIERYGANLSLDYHAETTQLYFRNWAAHYDYSQQLDQVSLRNSAVGGQTLPIGNDPNNSEYNLSSGAFNPYGIQPGHYFQNNDFEQKAFTSQFGGQTDFPSLRVSTRYDVAYSYGDYQNLDHYEGGIWGTPWIGAASGNGPGAATAGLQINTSNPSQPSPVLTSAAKAYLFNTDNLHAWNDDNGYSYSREGLLTLKDDVSWDIGAPYVEKIMSGIKWERGSFASDNLSTNNTRTYLNDPGIYDGGPGQPRFDHGLGGSLTNFPGSYLSGWANGYPGPFKLIDFNTYKNAYGPLEAANPHNQAGAAAEYAANSFAGIEYRYAGYVEAVLKFGAFELLPGVRYEYNESDPYKVGGAAVNFSTTYDEILPGATASYRPDDSTVFRAAIRKSYSRPAFDSLYGPIVTTVNPFNGSTSTSVPNPNLKPVESVNYDIGAAYYNHQGGVVDVSAYYKDLSNVVFQSTTFSGSASAPSSVSTSVNGLTGNALGVELSARQQLKGLPAPFDGFGLGASVTAQKTSSKYLLGKAIATTSLPEAPGLFYNLELFYAKDNFRGSINFAYRGETLASLQGTNEPDIYEQPTQNLNLSLSYKLPAGFEIGFAAQNLLKDYSYWTTYGKGVGNLADNTNGGYSQLGRTFVLNASYKY